MQPAANLYGPPEREMPLVLVVGEGAEDTLVKEGTEGLQCQWAQGVGLDALVEWVGVHDPDLVLFTGDPDTALARRVQALRERDGGEVTFLLLLGEGLADQPVRDFLAAGGNDYLRAELADSLSLHTRLTAGLALAAARRQLRAYRQAVDYHHALMGREETMARSVFNSVIHNDPVEGLPNLRWRLSEDALFNGDLILVAKSPGGKIHLMVGDFPGHGLAASIGSLPTAEIFYAMTAKGFELVEILLEINRRLCALLPVETFLAACFIEVDADQRTAHVWNGGLPAVLLHRAASGQVETLASSHTPLAILEGHQVGRGMQMVTLNQGDHLFVYTGSKGDGAGGSNSVVDLAEAIDDDLGRTLDQLIGHLARATAGDADKISLVGLRVDQSLESEAVLERGVISGEGNRAEWHYELRMGPETLRNYDPRPMLTQLLVEVQGLENHRERLYTIIAELFSNALEHGVLGLDSALKSSPEGFAEYYTQREMLLEELRQGTVRFTLGHRPTEEGGYLSIEVEDSGPGFDYERRGQGALSTEGYCGRGIGLIRQMADEVVYFSPGNRVKITFHWVKSNNNSTTGE